MLTASLNNRYANIRKIPSSSLQGRSPQQGVHIFLLAYAHEIHRIFTEDTIRFVVK